MCAVLVQVQRDSVGNVGVLKGSADDAAGARRVLDGVRDPPPRGAAAEVPGHAAVLGGVPLTGRGGLPAAGPPGADAPPASSTKGSLHYCLWWQRQDKEGMMTRQPILCVSILDISHKILEGVEIPA